MPRTARSAVSSLTSLAVRRRAQELAGRLDADAPTGPGTELVDELRATGTALSQAVVPPEDFRAALRTRLLAVAAVQADSPPATAAAPAAPAAPAAAAVSWRSGTRAGGVLAGALAGIVAVSGVAVAGSQSLPGDPFYGVKRTAEALSLRLSGGELDQGTRHLQLATTRLDEVRGLVLGRDAAGDDALPPAQTAAPRRSAPPAAEGPLDDRVRDTLSDMDERTTEGQALLNDVFRDDRDRAPLVTLTRWATRQGQRLEALLPSLPAATQDRARLSLSLITGIEAGAEQLLGSSACGPACDPSQAAPTAPPFSAPQPDPLPGLPGAFAPCGCVPLLPPAPLSTGPSAPTPSTQPGLVAPGLPEPSPTSALLTPTPTTPAPTTPGAPPLAPSRPPSPNDLPTAPAAIPGGLPLPAPLPVPSLPGGPVSRSPLPVPLQPPTLGPLPSLPPLPPAPGG